MLVVVPLLERQIDDKKKNAQWISLNRTGHFLTEVKATNVRDVLSDINSNKFSRSVK